MPLTVIYLEYQVREVLRSDLERSPEVRPNWVKALAMDHLAFKDVVVLLVLWEALEHDLDEGVYTLLGVGGFMRETELPATEHFDSHLLPYLPELQRVLHISLRRAGPHILRF